ncbi:hypothetical protein [Brevundimonas sp.]|uniref:hypothetical protein n=1 Tax=Brevundimonas sp. TaxID=1871086 RepID=UPI00286A50F1|nr:hypothetical protein [Brevundimonas sp.]
MLIALAVAALLGSEDPDGVVTTAPRGAGAVVVGAEAPTTDARPDAAQVVAVAPHNLTTREQIDRWVSSRAAESTPFAEEIGPQDDRKMHGFVSGSIGTNDYSSVSVGVSLPIGENGRLDLAYRQTKNGYGYGYDHPGYGIGYPAYRDEFGYGGPGYGARVRPWGAYDSLYGGPGRSRSMSVGLSWDEDRGRRERTPVIAAED